MRQGVRLGRHVATTAHVPVLYPWQAQAGGEWDGIYLGDDVLTSQPFFYDEFQLYADQVISSPNMVVIGQIGSGKSTAVKTKLMRSIGLLGNGRGAGRWAAIIDPKGEYEPLARLLGLEHLRLHPGGATSINPLDSTEPDPDLAALRRTDLVCALAAGLLRREPTPTEEAAIAISIRALPAAPTLHQLIDLLRDPTEAIAVELGDTVDGFVDRTTELRHSLESLTTGRLAGMFDRPTSKRLDWTGGNGVVIDVSSVFDDQRAFELVMIAATGWLQHLLTAPVTDTTPRRVQVLEEIWALLGNPRVARYYQTSQKLSRAYGVSNIAVAHRIADLTAQADDGTAGNKIAAGILADTETRVLFRQPPDQIDATRHHLGLTEPVADLLPLLPKGRAVWQVGATTQIIDHRVSRTEQATVWTDQALAH